MRGRKQKAMSHPYINDTPDSTLSTFRNRQLGRCGAKGGGEGEENVSQIRVTPEGRE